MQVSEQKIKELADFLPTWAPEDGWPANAPLTKEERNRVSALLWKEEEITWLRVLGTVLNPMTEGHYLEYSVSNHFTLAFPTEIERMFGYWIRFKHLKKYGTILLQSYHAFKVGAFYPAVTGIVPLAETVILAEGFRKNFSGDYKAFFNRYKDGIGVETAKVFTEILYEQEPRGGIDNRQPYNRHRLSHGVSPGAVTPIDVYSACLILDMVVSTIETKGNLLNRVLKAR